MGDLPLPNAVTPPGQPPAVITRAQWGADESMKCPNTVYDNGVRAGIVHHTAGSNDYGPQDSAAIVRSIYAYHTRTLGWCDIAYNALVDKYGQVFEGRAGGMDQAGRGRPHRRLQQEHLGVAMLGNFDVEPPTPDPGAHRRPAARLAAGHGSRRPEGHGRLDLRRRVVHPLPARGHTDPAVDLHPPRRRQHRMPRQRGVRGDGPDPRHRRPIQRTARTAEPDRLAARRRDPRQVGVDGRRRTARWAHQDHRRPPARAAPATPPSTRARSTGRRKAAPNPSPEPSMTAWASLGYERGALGLPTSGEIPGTAVDRAELPARHTELRPRKGHR